MAALLFNKSILTYLGLVPFEAELAHYFFEEVVVELFVIKPFIL